MQLSKNLSEFNQRLADHLEDTFPDDVEAHQDESGELLFRGPALGSSDEKHIGTHVAVRLCQDVHRVLEQASSEEREGIIADLVRNLGHQIRYTYDCDNIGPYAKTFTGTMDIVNG